MIRAFIAIALPREVIEYLSAVSGRLRQLHLQGTLVKPESIHLTLKFLGNVEVSRGTEIETRLRECCRRSHPFQLRVGGLGVFPDLRRPRVVWLGLCASPALTGLQQDLDRSLAEIGFEKEARPFRPHLTLLRLKSQRNVEDLSRLVIREGGARAGIDFLVHEVHFYCSELRPSGAVHTRLATAPLAEGRAAG